MDHHADMFQATAISHPGLARIRGKSKPLSSEYGGHYIVTINKEQTELEDQQVDDP